MDCEVISILTILYEYKISLYNKNVTEKTEKCKQKY